MRDSFWKFMSVASCLISISALLVVIRITPIRPVVEHPLPMDIRSTYPFGQEVASTVLSEPISAFVNHVQVASTDGIFASSSIMQAGCWADGELFRVVAVYPDQRQIGVQRGMLGTRALSHLAGSILFCGKFK